MTDNGFTIRKMKTPSIMKKENFGIMNLSSEILTT